MTIVVDGDEYIVEQVEKQLNKVIPVIKVKVLPQDSFVARELSLVKISCSAKERPEIMKIAELMNAKIIDVTVNTLTLEFTDSPERTDTLLDLVRCYGIKELVRTGVSAIEKGSNTARK